MLNNEKLRPRETVLVGINLLANVIMRRADSFQRTEDILPQSFMEHVVNNHVQLRHEQRVYHSVNAVPAP